MKNKLYIAITISLMTGCATTSYPMPETTYEKLSSFAGGLQHCFEKEYIGPQLYADTKNAFKYTLTTWDYDQNKMSTMLDDAYSQVNPDARECRQVEANALEMVSHINQLKVDRNQQRADKRQKQADINNALKEFKVNKPIFCNTIGTITTCN
jgi:hypothetical protein